MTDEKSMVQREDYSEVDAAGTAAVTECPPDYYHCEFCGKSFEALRGLRSHCFHPNVQHYEVEPLRVYEYEILTVTGESSI